MESRGDVCGRIALAVREQYVVWTDNGEIEATLSGRLRATQSNLPCVGDWVLLREGNVVTQILPRRTKLSRRKPGKPVREQVLASNVDVLFIVTGLDHDYNLRRLERYLVVAQESGARAVVLLNKADLQADVERWVQRTEKRVGGTPVIAISALTGFGIESVRAQMQPGETAALIGSSGVGKSTVVNALLEQNRQTTTTVRGHDQRGRHTTTRRELFRMPENWFLMDTPGLREVEAWIGEIDGTFVDISSLAAGCRFRNCRHETEPGCAVLAAGLDPDRLAGYRKLQREAAFLEREADPLLARATRKKWNALERAARKTHKLR